MRAFPDQTPVRALPEEHPFAVMVEVEAYDENDNADERLYDFLEAQGDVLEDGIVAQDTK